MKMNNDKPITQNDIDRLLKETPINKNADNIQCNDSGEDEQLKNGQCPSCKSMNTKIIKKTKSEIIYLCIDCKEQYGMLLGDDFLT